MAHFPTRVLVGVDRSPTAARAVDAATELCRSTGSELHLLHVRSTSSTLHGRPMTPPQRTGSESEGDEVLQAARRRVEDAGGEVAGAHLRFGDRVDREMLAAQQELQIGLLVLGSGGQGRLLQQVMSGTPSTTTARRSPASVLLVRHVDLDDDPAP